jgi:hypothetical protein
VRVLALALLLACGCGADEPSPAAPDLATHGGNCTLDTIDADCAAACWRGDGGLPGTASPDWPCQPDPLCVDGRWQFFCK